MGRPQSRMTRQRSVILEELCKVKSHPTADELYGVVRKRLPKISLGTVYRNLDFLVENGRIVRLVSAGAIRRYDGDITPHHHTRCVRCGRIVDIARPAHALSVADMVVPEFAAIFAVWLEFEGICDSCATLDRCGIE